MTNEQIDLELFKVCFPTLANLKKNKIRFSEGIYGEEIGVVGKLNEPPFMGKFITRFTDPEYGIVSIHKYLIPEMNRRGLRVELHQLWEVQFNTKEQRKSWVCLVYCSDDEAYLTRGDDPQPAVAISKAAYAALKWEKC